MKPEYFPVLIAVISALFGIVSVWINYRLTEGSRRLDREMNERFKIQDRTLSEKAHRLELYKMVYPEKFKATQSFMEVVGQTVRDMIVLSYSYSPEMTGKNKVELRTECQKIALQAHSLEWLLGSVVRKASDDLWKSCHILINRVERQPVDDEKIEQARYEVEKCYDQMLKAVRNELEMKEFETLFKH